MTRSLVLIPCFLVLYEASGFKSNVDVKCLEVLIELFLQDKSKNGIGFAGSRGIIHFLTLPSFPPFSLVVLLHAKVPPTTMVITILVLHATDNRIIQVHR